MARLVFALACFGLTLATNAAHASDAILLNFTSPNCGPCQGMKPILAELTSSGVPVRSVDVQREPHLARRYGIRSTPTFIVMRGATEVTRLVGAQSMGQLRQALIADNRGLQTNTNSRIAHPGSDPQTRLAPLQTTNQIWQRGGGMAMRREQEAEALPSLQIADAIQRAQAATVRLRVHDGHGFGVGTGTIIDTHGEEALVMTCGHLFRESEKSGRIEVDVFHSGQVKTVDGVLIDFDARDRDIALVAIRPGLTIQPIQVIPSGERVREGQVVFSFGCDRGADPSRRDTRVTGVDKYNQHLGMSNLEIAGAPIDGRSGGGLFDERGRLVGVCNAADYDDDLGIYTGPGSIHWQLDRVDLARLYQPGNAPAASQIAAVSSPTANQLPAASPLSNNPVSNAAPSLSAPLDPVALNAATPGNNALGSASGEMIVILRNGAGSADDQVVTLQNPDAELVRRIQAAMQR
ncbi:MAG: trypsin-like peptidase domain-containing protein [Planctomycetota bacterium]